MLTFLVYLLPIVASISESTIIKTIENSENYVLNVSMRNSLLNVRFIGDPDLVLNLSGKHLQKLGENAFNDVIDVESLDLSNNFLTWVPDFIFSNLIYLKTLSLANNRIWMLWNSFVGLENLRLLDISYNPIKQLSRGSLSGLPKFARILIDKNDFTIISADMSNNFLSQTEEMTVIRAQENTMNKKTEIEIIDDTESQNIENYAVIYNTTRLSKLCKFDGIVTTLDIVGEKEELSEGCVPIDASWIQIDLCRQNITDFQKNWYRLHSLPINMLDLSRNRITEIEKKTLNNLPAGLTDVNFQNNQIRKIQSQMIENYHLRVLNFKNNLIRKIKDNAFAKTKLYDLDLSKNYLTNLNFVSTLPNTMIIFNAKMNNIISIPNNIFSRLHHLCYLNLRENYIGKLENNIFQNLTSLETLILGGNGISTIEPAAFKGLTALKVLNLQENFIQSVQANTFNELTALTRLNLLQNDFVKIPFMNLPQTLNKLYLDFNQIRKLDKGSFVKVPRRVLSLNGNYISSIARGAFNLPTLRELYLEKNRLATIEGDSFEGLGRLRNLSLSQNEISEIHKGSCKNLGSLYRLDISSNPFEQLKAGAFYGLNTNLTKYSVTTLYIDDNNLKEMQAGLFDDI